MPIDKKLIKKCLKNDRRSQNLLYKELFSYIMNICIRYKDNYDDAGSALNIIYLKVLKGLSEYDDSKAILPWVKTIAVRHLIDEYRYEKRHDAIGLDDLPQQTLNGHAAAPDMLEVEDILQMLYRLPSLTKRVFNLFAIDGYKHREIGELLGMSEGNSKWHLNQARGQLQALIAIEHKRSERINLEI
ncbi:MAG: RNA polymerase sigma factor (sigma-70 family) [Bacteroidia bacterium]|jgi:RNA polymerase sigma factor (sigma-70 family)